MIYWGIYISLYIVWYLIVLLTIITAEYSGLDTFAIKGIMAIPIVMVVKTVIVTMVLKIRIQI